MLQNFDQHAQKGNEFLNRLANELGDKSNKEAAGRILRAVFRTLRNHLTLAENFQLLAQLPLMLKGIYVDGWSPAKKPEKASKKLDGFYSEILREEGYLAWKDFSSEEEITKAVKAVFKVLGEYVSKGQYEDMQAVLPKELKVLFKSNGISHEH